MSEISHSDELVTKQDLSNFYQGILPYLGGIPEMLANKFSKSDLYSSDEKMIGQWVNGKPVYQKTIVGTTLVSGVSGILHGISNLEDVVDIHGVAHGSNSGTLYVFNLNGGVALDASSFDLYKKYSVAIQNVMSNQIVVYIGSERASTITSYNITIQYTKTTDSAISIGSDTDYSTTEKIVGTWIDGKPLYQKTIDFGYLPNVESVKTVNHLISNISEVLGIKAIAKIPGSTWINISPWVGGTTSANSRLSVTALDVSMTNPTSVNMSGWYCYVTLQYTKS